MNTKILKFFLVSFFAMLGVAAHAQQVQVAMSNGGVQTFDADEVIYVPETAPTFYYGMADRDIEDLYVNGDVFTLPAGYKETKDCEFTLTTADTFDSSLYERCRSHYVVVPIGTDISFKQVGLPCSIDKESYSYTDAFGDKYDVYVGVSGTVFSSSWNMVATIDAKPSYFYGMADTDMFDKYVSDGVFSLPDGFKATKCNVFHLSKSETFDSKLYEESMSWYAVVPKGRKATFTECGADVPYVKWNLSYTDAFGNEYDVYMYFYDTAIQSDWLLKVSLENKPTFYYGMADRDIEDLYVDGDQFTLPAGYKETVESEFLITRANTFDSSLYEEGASSWYVVLPSGTSLTALEGGKVLTISNYKKSYTYTDAYGDKYDVYLGVTIGEFSSIWNLQVTAESKPACYYGMSDKNIIENYVHDGVFSLLEGYIETYQSSFVIANEIRYGLNHSWYVFVPTGSSVDFVDSSTGTHEKTEYIYMDALGNQYDVYFQKIIGAFFDNWNMKVTVTLPESN